MTTYEPSVNRTLHPALAIGLVSALTMILSACGTPAPKDFGGRWRPVNHFDDKAVEIPLAVPYTYYVTPMDGTLKKLVTRWTSDTGMKLSYHLRSDFTLTRGASSLRTTELPDAAARLTATYTAQGVVISAKGDELVVEEAPPTPNKASTTDGSGAR